MFLFTLHDFFLLLVKPGQAYLLIITRDDVVGQRHKLGSAFLSYFSWESQIALFFLSLPYPEPVPKKLCDFYWLQLRITYPASKGYIFAV